MDDPGHSPIEATDSIPPRASPDNVLSATDRPSTPRPTSSHRHFPHDSHQHHPEPATPGAQPVERLAHRLSKQSLKQTDIASPSPLLNQEPGTAPSSPSKSTRQDWDVKVLDFLKNQQDVVMESSSEDAGPSLLDFRSSATRLLPPPRRSLKRSIAEISSLDPPRKLPRPRHGPQYPSSASRPHEDSAPTTTSAEGSVQFAAEEMEIDAAACGTDADFLETIHANANRDAGRRRKIMVPFRSSNDAARQCSQLVRNVPRMRKRQRTKKDDGKRASASSSPRDSEYHGTPPEEAYT